MSDLGVPKYEMAYQIIVQRLKSGRYPIEAIMPTEGELATHFDVSPVTIGQLLTALKSVLNNPLCTYWEDDLV